MGRKRGELQIVGDQMFVTTGYTTRTEVVEHLLKPVMPLIAARVRLLLESAAKMFPDKCPHCGGAIDATHQKPGA